MNKTEIEWVKNPDGTQGYTWNPITGCLNHVNGLCKGGGFPCYAYKLAHGRLKNIYKRNRILPPYHFSDSEFPNKRTANKVRMWAELDPFYPRLWPERLKEPLDKESTWGRDRVVKHHQYPKGIFPCDMSDLFGIGIPEEWTRAVMDTIRSCPQHRFYLLTKQPQNLVKWSPFPENCWVGVTATNFKMFGEALYYLGKIEAKIKYISLELYLERILSDKGSGGYDIDCLAHDLDHWLDWLIIGAQTKPYKPPKIEWVQEIVQAADKAGVAVFLKDNLRPLLCTTIDGKDVIESHNLWAFRYFRLRQELPR